MSTEFKPCPFCGGTDIRCSNHGKISRDPMHRDDNVWSMCCYACGATFPNRYRKELLIEVWNRRPKLPSDAQITDEWIEREFAGYGMAMRREDEPPIPGEPLMSMEIAKELTRKLALHFTAALERIALLDEADGHELTRDHAHRAVAIATTALNKHPSEIKRPHKPLRDILADNMPTFATPPHESERLEIADAMIEAANKAGYALPATKLSG